MSSILQESTNVSKAYQPLSSSLESTTEIKTSFRDKITVAFEKGTLNRGNNPIIGLANLIGKLRRNSSIEEEKVAEVAHSQIQAKRRNSPLLESEQQLTALIVDSRHESSEDSTEEDFDESLSATNRFLFLGSDSDLSEDLRSLSPFSQYSEDGLFCVSDTFVNQEPTLEESLVSVLQSNSSLQQSLRLTTPIDKRSANVQKVTVRPLNVVQEVENEQERLMVIYSEIFSALFQYIVKLALVPFKIFLSILRFLINYDENMEAIHNFFVHSNNIMKQSDLFLTSINESELVLIASSLMKDLEEMSKELFGLSFHQNIAEITANCAKITEDISADENIKVLMSQAVQSLTSLNSLLSLFQSFNGSDSFQLNTSERITEILNSLGTIVDDMVFKGPFKGLMGAWDKYRIDRLESYEKLQTSAHFKEATAKEARDLEVLFKRYSQLLAKAKEKGANKESYSEFNEQLARLTSKLQHLNSQIEESTLASLE